MGGEVRAPGAGASRGRAREGGGPSWVGIGAQRCGTTWFTEMLCQHPEVVLGPGDAGEGGNAAKEFHFFERFLLDPWRDREASQYRSTFPRGLAAGEFTPAYLRSLWVAPLLRAACAPGTLLVVLLRDPVERFRSAVRWARTRPGVPPPADGAALSRWIRRAGSQALWAGMYATQLAAWSRHFARGRILILQYEAVVADPESAVVRAWRAMGLGPAPLDVPRGRTWNSSKGSDWEEPPGLADELASLYEPEVARLAREWGVDRRLWPSFA